MRWLLKYTELWMISSLCVRSVFSAYSVQVWSCYKFHILTVIFFYLTLYSTLEVQLWSEVIETLTCVNYVSSEFDLNELLRIAKC